MAAKRYPVDSPIFYWNERDEPAKNFRALEILIRDLINRSKELIDNHADLLDAPALPSYTVSGVPSAATAGLLIYVSDETGGATVAFSDGTNWRRVQDRVVIS